MLTPDEITFIDRLGKRFRECSQLSDEELRKFRERKKEDPTLREGLDVADTFWINVGSAIRCKLVNAKPPNTVVQQIMELPQFEQVVEASGEFNRALKRAK